MSDNSVNLEINGISLQADRGSFVIDVADGAGIFIPRFCYHKKLSVAANCRMCLVEVEKAPKPLPACATPVAEGMKVFTKSPIALRAQKAVMEFLLINHPLDCPICDQGGECELQDLAMGFGKGVSRFQERKRVVKDKNLGPLIATDMTRCIHCTRCVRFGEEIAGVQELGATGRGEYMEIGTFVERSVDSELSGNVIDLCPVGALTSKPFRFKARAWEMAQREAVSPHDAVGSNLHLHVHENRIMRVVPKENEEVNETWISDRDRFSYTGLYSEDRLRTPMVKRNGAWEAVDWETALATATGRLQEIVGRHGADQLGVLASSSATLEELYLLQKLARSIGCSNVDHRLRQIDFRDDEAAPLFPWLGQSLAQLEHVKAALLVGSNSRKEHPLANHRLRKATLGGAEISVVSCVDYECNYDIANKVTVSPSGMIRALAGIACAAVPARSRVPELLKNVVPAPAERAIAESLSGSEQAAVLLGPTAGAHPEASLLRFLVRAIAEASGATAGWLSDGANAAGGWIAGAIPHREPGGRPAQVRGLDAHAMLEKGLRAYLLLGVEPELDCADSHRAYRALSGASLTVCLTAYRTSRMEEYADVLLPIGAFAETSGTFVNMEGRWQSFDAAVQPLDEARPAWKVLRVMGNLLQASGFDYVQSTAVRDEVREQAGGTSEEHAGSAWTPPTLQSNLGLTGDELYRLGEVPLYAVDALVRRASALQETKDAVSAAIRVNREGAERFDLQVGDWARAQQDGMAVTLPVVIDDRVADGCVLIHAGIAGSVGLGPSFGPVTVDKAT